MEKLKLNWKTSTSLTGKIIRQIVVSDWRPDRVVGLSRGGLIPATMISHYFSIPMTCLQIQLRDHGEKESNCFLAEQAFGYDNVELDNFAELRRNILVVDDINDTGATLEWLKEDWRASCLPDHEGWNSVWNKNVRFAVLVDNLSSTFSTDYFGMEINKAEKDLWIEYPWENWWE